jgi:hypothetical protein
VSSDPMLSEVAAGALREHRTPPAERHRGLCEPPHLYSRVIEICRLVGEERFFRAVFSRARADQAGGTGPEGVRLSRTDAPYETWVLELDVDEVLHDALGGDVPGPLAGEAHEAVTGPAVSGH